NDKQSQQRPHQPSNSRIPVFAGDSHFDVVPEANRQGDGVSVDLLVYHLIVATGRRDRSVRPMSTFIIRRRRWTLLLAAVSIGIVVAASTLLRGGTDDDSPLASSTIARAIAHVTTTFLRTASGQLVVPRRAGLGVSRDTFVRA